MYKVLNNKEAEELANRYDSISYDEVEEEIERIMERQTNSPPHKSHPSSLSFTLLEELTGFGSHKCKLCSAIRKKIGDDGSTICKYCIYTVEEQIDVGTGAVDIYDANCTTLKNSLTYTNIVDCAVIIFKKILYIDDGYDPEEDINDLLDAFEARARRIREVLEHLESHVWHKVDGLCVEMEQ